MKKTKPTPSERPPYPTPDEIFILRTFYGLSTAEAASHIGVTAKTWRNYESGARRISMEFFDVIGMVFAEYKKPVIIDTKKPTKKRRKK